MKILMVSTECLPFAKIGGLADVVPALAAALRGCGHDVKILIPRCRGIAPELSPRRSDNRKDRTGANEMLSLQRCPRRAGCAAGSG